MRLSGKVAVITGASSGIGRATAVALAREGVRVALVARSEDALRRVAGELGRSSEGGSGRPARELMALVAPADVSRDDDVTRMAAQVDAELGTPDIVINNAGIGHWSSFASMSWERARQVMEVNFLGALRCTRAFLPAMLDRGSGTVAFVSSGLGELPFPHSSIYCASKFAMNGFARSLRAEIEPRGLRVLLVMPGGTDTEFFEASAFPVDIVSRYLGDLDSPDKVADRIVEALAADEHTVLMSWRSDLGLRLSYLFRRVTTYLLRRAGEGLQEPGPDDRLPEPGDEHPPQSGERLEDPGERD